MAPALKGKEKKVKKRVTKFVLDFTQPFEDKVIDPSAFELFLRQRIKVNGKTQNLGTKVNITKEKSKLNIAAEQPFSKRYLKYLTKKYLRKQELRDFLRVVATGKNTYELKYFSITDADAEQA
mmetsp:Transcript_5188/g.5309  ORF Transcript_5188/g.5309 Transcript_5188/m.5309 type:complete len:123 (+) Transcript_5188:55-423(+)